MNTDYVKLNLKSFLDDICAKHVVHSFELSGRDNDYALAELSKLAKICRAVNNQVTKESIELNGPEFRVYTKAKGIEETQYYALFPHLLGGHCPFVVFENQGHNKSQYPIKGVFVKMARYSYNYCPKTIKKLAKELFTQHLKVGHSITMKEAKKLIKKGIEAEKIDVPLSESRQPISFYIDVEHGVILSRPSKAVAHAIRAFFHMVLKTAEIIFPGGGAEVGINACLESNEIDGLSTLPFSMNAISQGLSSRAYNIDQIVDYYGGGLNENANTCPVMPTFTASAHAQDNGRQLVRFTDSICLFSGDSETEYPSFDRLSTFRKTMQLDYLSLRVITELPLSTQLKAFFELDPEYAEEQGIGNFVNVGFETSASNGNICFQIKERLGLFAKACSFLIYAHTRDNSVSPENAESVLLSYLGGLLEPLHDSTELFINLYLESSQIEKVFGEDAEVAA